MVAKGVIFYLLSWTVVKLSVYLFFSKDPLGGVWVQKTGTDFAGCS